MAIFDAFKLRILLQAAPWLIMRAQKSSPRLQGLLAEGPFILQIATAQDQGGHFELRNNRLRFHRRSHPSPTFSQTWVSAAAAAHALGSRDPTEMLRAMDDGRCRMAGEFRVGLWFNEAMKLARRPS